MSKHYIVRNCDSCNNEDSIHCQTGLCSPCELKDLKKGNEKIRESIVERLPIDDMENEHIWELINDLVENELNQEDLCNK